MSEISFTTKEQIIVDAFEAAASVADVTSADATLQNTYVAYIKMLNAKIGLHKGFIYLNRFLNHTLTGLTTELFTEFNGKLAEYIGYVTTGDFTTARASHNYIIEKLDSAMFLTIPRGKDFNATDFTVAENTDGTAAQQYSYDIDNTGQSVFVPP